MNRALTRAGIEEKYFHTGEVIMNYVAGPANGTPLVFIPAQGMNWEEYALVLPLLAPRFQVFAVTLRGQAKSSWTPGQYSFNQLGKDMTAFLKGVVGKPAIVAGNSSGGVLTMWLAANSPEWVKAAVCEDPPLFRCEWPAIQGTWVYDTFLGMTRMAVAGGGGFPAFFRDSFMEMAMVAKDVLKITVPPKPVVDFLAWTMAVQLAFNPGSAIDLAMLPPAVRATVKGWSQFDGNFSKAFVEGTVGQGFDHATAFAKITQPVLFLHAKWFMVQGRLMGALNDEDVARAQSLVKGPWKYVRVNCGHFMALEIPDQEAEEIISWADEFLQ